VETFRSIQLWITVAVFTLAPLPFGSVDQLWVAVWTALLSIGVLCGIATPISRRQDRLLYAFLAACCAYAFVAIIQVAPHMIAGLDDPIWQRVNELLGLNASPRISSRAEIPPVAIGHVLLLVTSFVSGFFVGTSRRNADLLVIVSRYSILLYATYGLVALALTPNMLLWAPKTAYRGSLTATFVNHNTAATMIGAGTILWFCAACQSLQSLQSLSLRVLLLIPSNEELAFKIIFRSAAGLTCFFALLLTGSRGGLICTSLGLFVAVGLMIANRLKPGFWYLVGSAIAVLAGIAVWLSHTGRIASQGLFDDGRWSVYQICIEAIRQRPLLGAGAGTFADIFPALRTAAFNDWGVWTYAHSTILEIAVEMGIPIAATAVMGAVLSFCILARSAVRSKDQSRSSLSAVAGIAVLSFLHSTIDFSLQIPGYLILFGILLGCGLAQATSDEPSIRRSRSRGIASFRPRADSRKMMPEHLLERPAGSRGGAP
jgi:O-antigen ligase